ncbi:HNH endonuclease [Roseisolibacter agri]|nr:hypothetical protein [Roseisolibacter agri]
MTRRAQRREGRAADSRPFAYLLTWNPGGGRGSVDASYEKLAAFARDERPWVSWSCGNSQGIPAGSRIFLLRQGRVPRGVVASGWVTRGSHEDLHWQTERRARGESAWYVGVGFDALLLDPAVEPPLDVASATEGPLTGVPWATPRSGIAIRPTTAAALEIAWTAHVEQLRPVSLMDDPELAAVEGHVRKGLVAHRSRERALRAAKLAAVQEADPEGRLQCEVPGCGFDFAARYGALGAGFAHVHHRWPLAELEGPRLTTLADLAVVCANCHAMIHRGGQCRELDDLITQRTLSTAHDARS